MRKEQLASAGHDDRWQVSMIRRLPSVSDNGMPELEGCLERREIGMAMKRTAAQELSSIHTKPRMYSDNYFKVIVTECHRIVNYLEIDYCIVLIFPNHV